MGSRTEVHRFVLHEGIAEQINTALKEDGTSRLAHWRAQVIALSGVWLPFLSLMASHGLSLPLIGIASNCLSVPLMASHGLQLPRHLVRAACGWEEYPSE